MVQSKLSSKKKYKKRRNQRPIIRITSDQINIVAMLLDAAILLLLAVWFMLDLGGVL